MYLLANINRSSVFTKDFQLCIRLFSLQGTPPHSQSSLSHVRVHIHAYVRAYSRIGWSMRDVRSTQCACNKRAYDQKCCGLRLSRDGRGEGGEEVERDERTIQSTLRYRATTFSQIATPNWGRMTISRRGKQTCSHRDHVRVD